MTDFITVGNQLFPEKESFIRTLCKTSLTIRDQFENGAAAFDTMNDLGVRKIIGRRILPMMSVPSLTHQTKLIGESGIFQCGSNLRQFFFSGSFRLPHEEYVPFDFCHRQMSVLSKPVRGKDIEIRKERKMIFRGNLSVTSTEMDRQVTVVRGVFPAAMFYGRIIKDGKTTVRIFL